MARRCFTPTLENGWVEAEENMRGDSFVGKFRCQPGFVLSGATTVKCRQGRWSVRPDNFPLCAGENIQFQISFLLTFKMQQLAHVMQKAFRK